MQSEECGMAAAMVAALSQHRRPAPGSTDQVSQNLMKIYMDKLKNLVPDCPKNKDVSKLELIQHVIDYINDLQDTLQNGEEDEEGFSSSPTPDTAGFSEAFNTLTFREDGQNPQMVKTPMHQHHDTKPTSTVYTSDGASDYDSRGSSPVNSSDTDCSSDDSLHPAASSSQTAGQAIFYRAPWSPYGAQQHSHGGVHSVNPHHQHQMYTAHYNLQRADPSRQLYTRKNYGMPPHL